jgi:hypothetical protein
MVYVTQRSDFKLPNVTHKRTALLLLVRIIKCSNIHLEAGQPICNSVHSSRKLLDCVL